MTRSRNPGLSSSLSMPVFLAEPGAAEVGLLSPLGRHTTSVSLKFVPEYEVER